MADSEILFDDVSNLGDFFVSFDFQGGEFRRGRVFPHDAVGDLVGRQKVSIRFAGVSLVSEHLFDGLFGMPAIDGAIGQIVGVVYRSRCRGSGQDETVVDVHGRMFLESVMGNVLLNDPIRVQVARKFLGFSVFIEIALGGIAFFFKFLQLLIGCGAAGGLDESGVDGNAFVDAQALCLELS